MTFQKNAFVNFIIFTIAFKEVVTWTIDLPEVRKFLFEKNELYKKYNKNEYEDYLSKDQTFYSNIEGNSKHNSKDYEHEHHIYDREKYADEYGYYTYMEKKVHNIVRDGSTYLEGLRRSLEEYSMFLENCNRQNSSMQNTTSASSSNSTTWKPEYDPPSSSNMSSLTSSNNFSTSMLNFDNYDNATVPMRPNSTESRGRGKQSRRLSCEEATEASEQVKKYADLAMHSTKRLQDLAYAKKYQKTDEHEENELILKLAWFLDRLAYLSGYEPEYNKDYEPTGTRSPPTEAPTAPTLVPSSDEMNQEMIDCLQRNSSTPATERCRYPLQLPDLIAQMYNSGSSSTPSSNPSSESDSVLPMNSPPDNIADQSLEILITADNSSPNTYLPKSSITKRSTEYTYYFPHPHKPLHELTLTHPIPIVKLIKHRLSNIKAILKSIVERRLAHITEKKEENQQFDKHFEKRSIDENNVPTSNFIVPLSNNPKPIVKSVEKQPLDQVGSPISLIHYPVSDVSVINTKSFKKRSIDVRGITSNHINLLSNSKSVVRPIGKGPLLRKKFEHFLSLREIEKRLGKHPVSGVKSIKKRYTVDPLSKLANYYMKYKVWDKSNPVYTKKKFIKKGGIFEVKNHLNEPKVIHKRSLFQKKAVHIHVQPLQIFPTYVHGYRHHPPLRKPTLLSHLQKLHDLKHKKLVKIHKKITKRSAKYEHMYLPRISMDPQGDISYYVKNKEGTDFNPDLVQAGQVRLGLEQVFQTGNIEIVRRFGANYNPLNPAPFYTGILASMADA